MQKFDVIEIAAEVSARLLQEYPLAIFEASPIAINKRINQQASGPGGRVVMAPGSSGIGKPMFAGPEEAFCVLDTYDFYCFGWSSVSTSWIENYARAQRLCDTVMRAFYPYQSRIQMTSLKPSGDQQSNQTGAQIQITFSVRRPVAGQLGPLPSAVTDGGALDISNKTITNIDPSVVAIR